MSLRRSFREKADLRPLFALLGSCLFAATFARVSLSAAADTDDASMAIVGKYIDATHAQQEALRGEQMHVDIDAKLPKLEKQGKLQALRNISRLGQITYHLLGFSGDNTVKQEVIARYLAAETEARDSGAIAITPANYKFKYKGPTVYEGRVAHILQITPKRKEVGLFKGELWVDAETGMPLRESGQFVKNPSIFLKKVEFVREYEIQDGVAFPKHIESTVDTRLVGKAELEVSFSNFTKEVDAGDNPAALPGNQ